MKYFVWLILACFLLWTPLKADIVYLQDGAIVKGKIVDQNEEKVFLRTTKGIRMGIPWFKIKKIEKGGQAATEIYKKKLSKIKMGDAEGHYRLGLWLLTIHLNKEAHEEFTKAIIIDPNHKQARRQLGYILTPQGWRFPTETPKKEVEVEHPSSGYRGQLPRELQPLLRALGSRHASERNRALRALRKIRQNLLRKWTEGLFSGDPKEVKKILKKLKKIDSQFVSDFQKDSTLTKEKKLRAEKAVAKFLKAVYDAKVLSYFKYLHKKLLAKFHRILKKLGRLVSLLREGKNQALQKKYLEEWKKTRKEALRVIFDKKIYPDENHGRVGQPTVDEKVKAMRAIYEFFDILLGRSLDKINKLSAKKAAQILDLLKSLKTRIQDYSQYLTSHGISVPAELKKISPRIKALVAYRAGRTQAAKKATAQMGHWGKTMLKRMIAKKIMAYNKKIASQKNSPLSGVEARQIRITNEYRISMGRTPLEIDAKLVRCARKHSIEMVKLGYFAHESPVAKNKTPSMRAQNEGHDGNVGENIYMNGAGATAQSAFDGWYHSSGHHRNILNDRWTCIGVGHSGTHMTQDFGTCTNCSR